MSPEPGPEASRQVPQIALIGGGALLVVGVCLIVLAMVRPGGSADQDDAINLATAAGPTAAPVVLVTPTATPATSVASATEKPKPKATTSAAKPKATTAKPQPTKTVARATAVPDRSYLLRNVITGNCLSTMTFNTGSTQEKCGSAGKIRLEATRAVNGVQLHRLREAGGADLCLDVLGKESSPSGTAVGVVECVNPSSEDNQEWQLKDTGRTRQGRVVYLMVNFLSGNCLDVVGSAGDKSDRAAGLALSISTCEETVNGFDDHYWTFS